MAATTGQHIQVNDASLYVEEHGEGVPLVFVHSGLGSSVVCAGIVPLLAEQFHVITFDTRGHGQSTNPSGELSYELIADDTAALIEALELENPVVGGWSDGGQVALELGLRHPGSAMALIVGAAYFDFQSEANQAKMREFFQVDSGGMVDFDAFVQMHEHRLLPMMRQWQPNGDEQVRTILQQSATMWLTYPGLTRERVNQIDVPTLVVHADHDELIDVDVAVDIFQWLPNGELAVLPGASHMRPLFEPATFAAVVTDFVQRQSKSAN